MKKLLIVFWTAGIACQNQPATPVPATPEAQIVQDTIVPPVLADTTARPVEMPETAAPESGEEALPPAAKVLPPPTPSSPAPAAAAAGKGNFTDLATLDATIQLDIRYATTNNFTKAKIYDCPACLLRPEAARAIVTAHKNLKKKGLGLKMFDCYRPAPYQQRLWDKVPDPDYVTPPAKGSMHSRGAAVDLTLVDVQGKELDMGTPYDFFGVQAHTDYTKLPAKVLENRRLLREAMEAAGFKGIRTEWWHFSFRGKNYPLSSYLWPCD